MESVIAIIVFLGVVAACLATLYLFIDLVRNIINQKKSTKIMIILSYPHPHKRSFRNRSCSGR
jgi:hypothetical protein